ncbi:hypothetical protein MAR_011607 [Mya arenaria]|uniref:Uncharacterized protein n=1 Tax=Mya arenaria TaxID=6604 RepID=A0ABY7FUL7_MYAAR|nr:hypothetical protein MAR_011607 [Mya arenaria]
MGSVSSKWNRRRDGSTSVQVLNRGPPQNLAQVGPSTTPIVTASGQNTAGGNIQNTARHGTEQGQAAPIIREQINPDYFADNLPGAVQRDLSSVSLRSGPLPEPNLLKDF